MKLQFGSRHERPWTTAHGSLHERPQHAAHIVIQERTYASWPRLRSAQRQMQRYWSRAGVNYNCFPFGAGPHGEPKLYFSRLWRKAEIERAGYNARWFYADESQLYAQAQIEAGYEFAYVWDVQHDPATTEEDYCGVDLDADIAIEAIETYYGVGRGSYANRLRRAVQELRGIDKLVEIPGSIVAVVADDYHVHPADVYRYDLHHPTLGPQLGD